MVALFVVALTLPSLLSILDQQIDGTAYMRDRAIAQLVASNRMEELRLGLRSGQVRLTSNLKGSEEVADREWFWSFRTQETELPNFARVELEVRTSEEDDALPVYTLVAFLAAGVSSQ